GTAGDEPTPDGKVSLEHVECNAACDYAPVVMVNWEFFDDMTPDTARELIDGLRAGKDIAPSRGAPRLVTWKQAARILAGFPDGQATGGQPAGPATRAGLRIARERGGAPDDAGATVPSPAAGEGGAGCPRCWFRRSPPAGTSLTRSRWRVTAGPAGTRRCRRRSAWTRARSSRWWRTPGGAAAAAPGSRPGPRGGSSPGGRGSPPTPWGTP